ncbi:MAG: hypothetical protein IH850_09160 [Acidobacteria bacterium]|nr:hypothetical protein [Acidobacteriota bacterium]
MPKFFILIAAVALIAAACGGSAASSDDDVPSAPTTIATTTTVADDHADDDHAEEASDDDHTDAEADRAIEISMTEFAFGVDSLEVAAGETIEFVVTNAGVVPHEFRLSNAQRIEDHIASGHEGHIDNGTDDGDEAEADGDIVMLLEAGETSTIVVTFPDDTTLFTELVCLIPGHYEAGMHTEIAYTG